MKILITGGPRVGKSYLAKELSIKYGIRHYCTDPQNMCDPHVNGVPDFITDWSEQSKYVVQNWIGKKDLIEGVAVPRSLRKWRKANPTAPLPCDRLIILEGNRDILNTKQEGMKKSTLKIMKDVIDSWPELGQIAEVINIHGNMKVL